MILPMEKTCKLLIIFYLIITDVKALPKPICIIGAGRAGLAAIKIVAEQTGKFIPIGFERNSDVGGLWIYTDKTDSDEHGLPVHSSVYKNLKTITTKEQMVYPDYPFFRTTDNDFMPHHMFLEYMRNYADQFGLKNYIQFNTMVTKVTPLIDNCRRAAAWQITTRNLDTNTVDQIICDAVMVCNGRYSKPNIPKVPGIELFSGQVLHSHNYRQPENFTAKTVIVWGSGASAIGITHDLSNYAKTVFFSHRQKLSMKRFWWGLGLPSNAAAVENVVKFDGHDFVLGDNTKITADVFIYCTGYVYDFPFLDDKSGIVRDKNRLFPLTKDFINMEHPSMAFIGLGDFDHSGDALYDESNYFVSTLK